MGGFSMFLGQYSLSSYPRAWGDQLVGDFLVFEPNTFREDDDFQIFSDVDKERRTIRALHEAPIKEELLAYFAPFPYPS